MTVGALISALQKYPTTMMVGIVQTRYVDNSFTMDILSDARCLFVYEQIGIDKEITDHDPA